MLYKLFFTLLFICHTCTLFSENNDREIESAYMALFSNDFGYTLIGEKPISIEDGLISEYLFTHPATRKKFFDSLQNTFKNSKKFLFKIIEEDQFYWLEIIHKQALNNLIRNNQQLQQFIKKKFVNADCFYKKLKNPKTKIFDLLGNEFSLRGILLGYGEANAHYFCRRCIVGKYLNKFLHIWPSLWYGYVTKDSSTFPKKIKRPYEIQQPVPDSEFSSLTDEWKWIQNVAWHVLNEQKITPPYFVALPLYVSRHGGDSEMIYKNFCLKRAKVASLFSEKSYYQAVFEEAKKSS